MMPSGFADLCARRDETSGKWQVYCGSHMRASRSMRPIDLSARRRDNLQHACALGCVSKRLARHTGLADRRSGLRSRAPSRRRCAGSRKTIGPDGRRPFSSPWRVDETLRLQPTVTALKTVFLSRQAGGNAAQPLGDGREPLGSVRNQQAANSPLRERDTSWPGCWRAERPPVFRHRGGEHVNALLPRTPL